MNENEVVGEARGLKVIAQQHIFLIAVYTATIGFALMSYLITARPQAYKKQNGSFKAILLPCTYHPYLLHD